MSATITHTDLLKDNPNEHPDCQGPVELRKSRMYWDDVYWDIYQCTACGATIAACQATWWNHTMQEYFTREEALGKVGKTVKTLTDFSGIPTGATGVVQPFEGDDYKTLGIQWNLPGHHRLWESMASPKDWFSRTEYFKYLEEIEEN